MAVRARGTVTVQDSNGQRQVIDASDFDFDMVSSEERSMGQDLTHEATYDIEPEATEDDDDDYARNSGNTTVTVTVSEYPEGSVGEPTIDVDNGKLISSNMTIEVDE